MSEHFCHPHNLVDRSEANQSRPWGIRVSAPPTDPFNRLVGADWQRERWFASERERDEALQAMKNRHGYYRVGDDPSVVLEPIDPA